MKQMQELNALNRNRRYNDPGAFCEPGMGTFCPIYDWAKEIVESKMSNKRFYEDMMKMAMVMTLISSFG